MSTRTSSSTLRGSPYQEHVFVIQGNNVSSNNPDTILNEVKKMDDAMHSLSMLKSQCCRQLNTISSSTRSLPNEILLAIFQIFCSLSGSQRFPQFVLGGVCSRWRDLVNGEPRFWKSIDLRVRSRIVSNAVSLLEVFKERNGAFFEFMQLKFKRLHDEKNSFEQLLLAMKGLAAPRIALHEPPVDLLRVVSNNFDTRDVSLAGLSCVTDELKSVPGSLLPWSALTTLRLSSVRTDTCCDLLLGCPNLIRFSSHDPSRPNVDCTRPHTRHAREISFPYLQHLTWQHSRPEWDDNLLSFYRFPKLQHFHWRGHNHYHSFRLFHDFTSFLPQSCRTFQLSTPEDPRIRLEMDILLQISAHPGIEQLICSHFDMTTLSVALERLQDPTFLPSLRGFKWEHRNIHSMPMERFLELAQLFKGAIRRRKEVGDGGFRMEIEGVRLPYGFGEQGSCELTDDGFDFDVTEEGSWIFWF